ARLSNWGFHQLRSFVSYKAALLGVPVLLVDPRNTSRTCPECGHVAKENAGPGTTSTVSPAATLDPRITSRRGTSAPGPLSTGRWHRRTHSLRDPGANPFLQGGVVDSI